MTNLRSFALIFALLMLTPTLALAQRGPTQTPCDCDTCFASPQVTCNAGPSLGSGNCSLYYYLFCYPWHNPGNSATTGSDVNEKANSWRPQTVADFLFATAPAAEGESDEILGIGSNAEEVTD